ncbi:dihydroneopterin aldolase [Cytobacillus sp. Hm23]
MDKIVVNEMMFYGYHGVFTEETKLGQRFLVDVELHLDLSSAGQTDQLQNTVNYGEVYEICQRIVEGKPYKLIEAVGERIAADLLATFVPIEECTVKITKPGPPIPGYYKDVAVFITRSR